MIYFEDEKKNIVRMLFAGVGFQTSSFAITRLLQIARVMVFARLFTPTDLGTATLAISCISIASILTDFGFPISVIRSQDNSTSFTNTIFTLSLTFGVVLLILLLAGAPLFSKVFSTDLDNYVRFLAFMVLGGTLKLPNAFWEKELKFAHPSIARVIPEFIKFVIAVVVEVRFHLGVWSLLIGHFLGFSLSVLYIWVVSDFRPHIQLERKHIRPLLSFGGPLLFQGINGEIMARGDNLIIGAFCEPTQLAYYNFAWQLPMMISALTSTVDSLLLPVYARLNESHNSTIKLFNLTNKLWSITGSLIGFFILLYANQIVCILYGPKWKPVVPILQVMCLSFIIRFCTGYSYDKLALVRGRTKYLMKWGFVNTFLVFSLGLLMIQKKGPIGGAWFWVIQSAVLNPFVRLPLIYQELHSIEYLQHIWQPIFSGIVACLCSYMIINYLPWSDSMILATSIAAYLIVYLTLLFILDRKFVGDVKKLILLAQNKKSYIYD